MSVGPLTTFVSGIAGAPMAQTRGSEVERALHDASNLNRQAVNETRAEAAAGIGETNGENHEPAERDADGRRFWEEQPASPKKDDSSGGETGGGAMRLSKDATGKSGRLVDLTG